MLSSYAMSRTSLIDQRLKELEEQIRKLRAGSQVGLIEQLEADLKAALAEVQPPASSPGKLETWPAGKKGWGRSRCHGQVR